MSEKIKLHRALVVEGKYDKIKLSALVDGVIIVTNGFGIYRDDSLRRLIRSYAESCGLIVMTDSDRAGRQIRGYIKSFLPPELHGRIAQLHIPRIEGKERRKSAPSKEGTLGVEGIDAELLRELLRDYAADEDTADSDSESARRLCKNDLYTLGISGGANSGRLRRLLCRELGFPEGLSASALLDLLNSQGYGERMNELENAVKAIDN